MKLIMTLLVRNEEDIIRENLLFHLNMGVDFFIVTDNNSIDSTPEILSDFEQQGLLYLIRETEDNYAQSVWVTRMARMAKTRFYADWIINGDADEFWWSNDLDLKMTLSYVGENISVVFVQRYDFVPTNEFDKSVFTRMIYRDNESKNHMGNPLPPKICHKAMEDVIVSQGNHDIQYPTDLKTTYSEEIEIFHFPIRSWEQFSNKIIYGGAAYARNVDLPPDVGDGWRKLYQYHKNGTLMDYFTSKMIGKEEIHLGMQSGTYSEDLRLRNYMVEKHIIY
ncbi:MAG: glycosyltransferase family 2 protein [Bacteroidales bacterium]|nr:glycosyltransferase family 2 protein [Bacteroidales bacterium]